MRSLRKIAPCLLRNNVDTLWYVGIETTRYYCGLLVEILMIVKPKRLLTVVSKRTHVIISGQHSVVLRFRSVFPQHTAEHLRNIIPI